MCPKMLPGVDLIFGQPWLRASNPRIDWAAGQCWVGEQLVVGRRPSGATSEREVPSEPKPSKPEPTQSPINVIGASSMRHLLRSKNAVSVHALWVATAQATTGEASQWLSVSTSPYHYHNNSKYANSWSSLLMFFRTSYRKGCRPARSSTKSTWKRVQYHRRRDLFVCPQQRRMHFRRRSQSCCNLVSSGLAPVLSGRQYYWSENQMVLSGYASTTADSMKSQRGITSY